MRADPGQSKILLNSSAFTSLAFAAVQQIIVASSTLWIARLAQDVILGRPSGPDLVLLILSLVLPYAPGVISLIAMEQWKQEARRRFVEAFAATHFGVVSAWGEFGEREPRTAFLAQESGTTLSEFIAFLHDVASTAANVILNVAAVAFAVDSRYGVAYSVSAVISLLLIRLTQRRVARTAAAAQLMRVDLTTHLMRAWDNLALGNSYSREIWMERAHTRLRSTRDAAVQETVATSGTSTLTALFSMIPVIGTIGWVFLGHTRDPAVLAPLVATLPRQLLLINHLYVLVERATTWSALASKLKGLGGALKPPEAPNLTQRVHWSLLRFLAHREAFTPANVEEVRAALGNLGPGRFTLRGPNGSGKSALLLLLKQELVLSSLNSFNK